MKWGFWRMKDNVKWTIGKGQSRRGNGLRRVILFLLFWDSAALSNSDSLNKHNKKWQYGKQRAIWHQSRSPIVWKQGLSVYFSDSSFPSLFLSLSLIKWCLIFSGLFLSYSFLFLDHFPWLHLAKRHPVSLRVSLMTGI